MLSLAYYTSSLLYTRILWHLQSPKHSFDEHPASFTVNINTDKSPNAVHGLNVFYYFMNPEYLWMQGFTKPINAKIPQIHHELTHAFSTTKITTTSHSNTTLNRDSVLYVALSYSRQILNNTPSESKLSSHNIQKLAVGIENLAQLHQRQKVCIWVDELLLKNVSNLCQKGPQWIQSQISPFLNCTVLYFSPNHKWEIQDGFVLIQQIAASLMDGIYAITTRPQNDHTVVSIHPSITETHDELLSQQNNPASSQSHISIQKVQEGEKKCYQEAEIQIACLVLQGMVSSRASFLKDEDDLDSLILWANEVADLNPSVPIISFSPPLSFLDAKPCRPAWSPSGYRVSKWTGKKEWVPRLYNWESIGSDAWEFPFQPTWQIFKSTQDMKSPDETPTSPYFAVGSGKFRHSVLIIAHLKLQVDEDAVQKRYFCEETMRIFTTRANEVYREMHQDRVIPSYIHTKRIVAEWTGHQVNAVPHSYYKDGREPWLCKEKGLRDFMYSVPSSLLCPNETHNEDISQKRDLPRNEKEREAYSTKRVREWVLRAEKCFLAKLSYSSINRDLRTGLPVIQFTMRNTRGTTEQGAQTIFQVLISMDVTTRSSHKGIPVDNFDQVRSESLAVPEHWKELRGYINRIGKDCSDKRFLKILEECYIHWVRYENNKHTIGMVVTRNSDKGEKLRTDGRLAELYEQIRKSKFPVRCSFMEKAYILLAYTIEKEDSLTLNSKSLALQKQALTMNAPHGISIRSMVRALLRGHIDGKNASAVVWGIQSWQSIPTKPRPKRFDLDSTCEIKEKSSLYLAHDVIYQKKWNIAWIILTVAGVIMTGALWLVRGNAEWEERLGVSVAVLPIAAVAFPLGLVKVVYQQWDLSDLWRGRRKMCEAVKSNAVAKEDFTRALILSEKTQGMTERNFSNVNMGWLCGKGRGGIDIPMPFSSRCLKRAGFQFPIGSEGSRFLKRKYGPILTVTETESDIWAVEKTNNIEWVTDAEWWEDIMIG